MQLCYVEYYMELDWKRLSFVGRINDDQCGPTSAKMWRRSFLGNVAELRDLMPFLHVFLLVVVQVH